MMNFSKTGYLFSVSATALVLLWIGILKFTPAESIAIKPYVENSILMSWLYGFASVQTAWSQMNTHEHRKTRTGQTFLSVFIRVHLWLRLWLI